MTKRNHFCKGEYCQSITTWYLEGSEWRCGNCGREEPRRETRPRASRIEGYKTPSQIKALEYLRWYFEKDLNEKYGEEITKFETKVNDYDGSLWLSVETEYMGLPETNLLRALDHDYWHFLIGRSGKMEAHSYPKSFEQFKGRKAFGFWVK